MQIIFFCPPTSVINGGIRHIFRMAETLIDLGHDAVVCEQNQQRPTWFSSTAPIVGPSIFNPGGDQVYVLPEDQPHILAEFKKFPQKKVIYSQNHFFAALGIPPTVQESVFLDAKSETGTASSHGERQLLRCENHMGVASSYADYGVTHILCSSQTIYNHARRRHPLLQAHVIPCAVNAGLFKSATVRKNTIAFMPRKRKIEATYIRDMFRFTYPEYRDWAWHELSDKSETDIARAMGEARVFLSLSRLEGFGLTPLEAMAAGCVVAGFTGIGGREYATDHNGLWAEEDDFPTCIEYLKRAAELSLNTSKMTSYAEACRKTLALYTPETFATAVKKGWAKILD